MSEFSPKTIEDFKNNLKQREDEFILQIQRIGNIKSEIPLDYSLLKDTLIYTLATDKLQEPVFNPEGFISALWDFTHVLEEASYQLFQETFHFNFFKWELTFIKVVQEIKDCLMDKIEKVVQFIYSIEPFFNEYCHKFSIIKKNKWLFFLQTHLHFDVHLISHLKQTQKFLEEEFLKFLRLHDEFMTAMTQTDNALEDRKKGAYGSIKENERQLYRYVVCFLKVSENKRKEALHFPLDYSEMIKKIGNEEEIYLVFKKYQEESEKCLFKCSIEWKYLNQTLVDRIQKDKLKKKVEGFKTELKYLMDSIIQYRKFKIKNDPNPYVRTILGFSESIVGPEPQYAKQLSELIYSNEDLIVKWQDLLKAFDIPFDEWNKRESQLIEEMQNVLHEKRQLVMSEVDELQLAEQLLHQFQQFDEVASPNLSLINTIDHYLSLITRDYRQKAILEKFQSFHHFCRIHFECILAKNMHEEKGDSSSD